MDASQGWERKRILITVKTYPTPSAKYRETVCTAGVASDGQWIRLYPVSFRYRPYEDWYKKYQWVEVDVKRKISDPRRETYTPNCDTLVLGEHLDTNHGWERGWGARRSIVLPTAVESMHVLQAHGASLGVFKPAEVMDFTWEPDTEEWTVAEQARLGQLHLFEKGNKPLEKIPWKFHYDYRCADPMCKGHHQQILDWELFEGYRRWRHQYGSIEETLLKLREKWLDWMWRSSRDSYLFVGTHYLHRDSFMVLGVFSSPFPPGR